MNPLIKVAKIMSTNLVTVMESTPLTETVALFKQHRIHHIPVVAADRTLEGLISQTDLTKLIGRDPADFASMTAKDLMTEGLAKLDTSDNVATAANLFMLNRFHALPVVEGERIVGMVTTLDLVKLIDQEEVELEDYKEA